MIIAPPVVDEIARLKALYEYDVLDTEAEKIFEVEDTLKDKRFFDNPLVTSAPSIKKLKQANERKTKFLTNMSNELRTPLSAIIGFSRLMQDDIKVTSILASFLNICAILTIQASVC